MHRGEVAPSDDLDRYAGANHLIFSALRL